jgi:hypothetical protein
MKRRKPRPAFVRISLTIPAELKLELDELAAGQNWSAWAADCFRSRILQIKAREKGVLEMSQIVDRLKAAAKAEAFTDFDDGFEIGRKWAGATATPAQLRRLQSFKREVFDRERLAKPEQWPELVANYITNEPGSARDFWEDLIGTDQFDRLGPSKGGPGPFLRGFVEGALEVWKKVQASLET